MRQLRKRLGCAVHICELPIGERKAGHGNVAIFVWQTLKHYIQCPYTSPGLSQMAFLGKRSLKMSLPGKSILAYLGRSEVKLRAVLKRQVEGKGCPHRWRQRGPVHSRKVSTPSPKLCYPTAWRAQPHNRYLDFEQAAPDHCP